MTDSKPSKSARKREQSARQDLGEQLLGLPDDLLHSLGLDERLMEALASAKRMKSREALRRQKQYIGKLMRDLDTAPIETLFAKLQADDRRQKRLFALAERWRDRIVAEGTPGLQAFAAGIGEQDERLANLLRDLQHTTNDRDETALRRNIFRRIHEILAARAAD